MKKMPLIYCFVLFSLFANSQSVSLSTGFGLDANNQGKSMAFIPVEARWQPLPDIPMSLTINYDNGLTSHKDAEAFTLNPNLPGNAILKENYRTSLLTFGINIDIKLLSTTSKDEIIFSVIPLAFSCNNTKVSYKNFDKENYTILNEDIDESPSGLAAAFGLRYLFNKNKMISLNIQTPLLKRGRKDFNFNYAAPARLMLGYEFNYKKSK